MALPVFARFMQKIYADSTLGITQEDIFEIPPNFDIRIDCDVNDLSGGNTNAYEYEFWEDEFK